MHGGSCSPAAHFPDPNSRSSGGRRAIDNRGREPRRPTFFSRRLNHVSAVLQDPASMTLREFGILVFTLYALYRAFFAAGRTYDLLARQPVARICPRHTAMQCLRLYGWLGIGVGYDWAADVVPWAIVAVVLVFLGEEVLRATRTKLKA